MRREEVRQERREWEREGWGGERGGEGTGSLKCSFHRQNEREGCGAHSPARPFRTRITAHMSKPDRQTLLPRD